MSHQLLKNEIYPTPKKNEIDLLSNKKVEPQVFGPPKKLSPPKCWTTKQFNLLKILTLLSQWIAKSN